METCVDKAHGVTKNISLKPLASEVFISSLQQKLYSQKPTVIPLSAIQLSQVDSAKAWKSHLTDTDVSMHVHTHWFASCLARGIFLSTDRGGGNVFPSGFFFFSIFFSFLFYLILNLNAGH